MSFLSSSFSNSKRSYKSRTFESMQFNSVVVFSDFFRGFRDLLYVLLYFVAVPSMVEFFQFVAKSPVSRNRDVN